MLPLGKSRKSRIMEAGGPEISAGTEVADVHILIFMCDSAGTEITGTEVANSTKITHHSNSNLYSLRRQVYPHRCYRDTKYLVINSS